MGMSNSRLCLIGFGEAGGEIARSLEAWRGASTAPLPALTAFDIKIAQPDSADLLRSRLEAVGVGCVYAVDASFGLVFEAGEEGAVSERLSRHVYEAHRGDDVVEGRGSGVVVR